MSSSGASLHHSSLAARQSSGYSKLAAAPAAKLDVLDWLWSESTKLLPTGLSGREFTHDAAANDNGDNALCTNFCSPSDSFMSKEHTRHVWINAPFTQLTAFVQHYLHCKQLSPDSTSASILVPGYLKASKASALGHDLAQAVY